MLCALAAVGCGFIEAEEPSVCKGQNVIEVPAYPFGQLEAEVSFPFEIGSITEDINDDKIESTVRLNRVTLTASTGITDFSWLSSAAIIADGETLVSFQGPATGNSITLTGNSQKNLLDYAQPDSEEINLTLKFQGTMPAQDWSADAQGCMYAKVRVDYF
jgi:hypothetical protein